uniref:Uncharacterized protein n=1 Tax=Oryza barthii TaxID=65489 RepID=A0A0D3GC52_9ORYZ
MTLLRPRRSPFLDAAVSVCPPSTPPSVLHPSEIPRPVRACFPCPALPAPPANDADADDGMEQPHAAAAYYYGHKLHATAGIPFSWICRCHRLVLPAEYRVWLQGSSKSNEELPQKPGKD